MPEDDDPRYGEITPPSTFTVDHERRPILYLPDGRVLVKPPAGFRPDRGGIR